LGWFGWSILTSARADCSLVASVTCSIACPFTLSGTPSFLRIGHAIDRASRTTASKTIPGQDVKAIEAHPAGPADCEAAAMWVIDHAPTEYGTSALVLGGESAGSTLAAVTALRLRDRHGYTGLSGLNLSQGAYDLRLTPTLRAYGQRRLILNTPTAQSLLDRYAQAANREDPDVSPLFADLAGMPRALFTVGTLDPLLDDTGFMYFRWIAARNHAELDVYPGAMHGFNLFPTALGRQACARIDRFIGGCVREESSGG